MWPVSTLAKKINHSPRSAPVLVVVQIRARPDPPPSVAEGEDARLGAALKNARFKSIVLLCKKKNFAKFAKQNKDPFQSSFKNEQKNH